MRLLILLAVIPLLILGCQAGSPVDAPAYGPAGQTAVTPIAVPDQPSATSQPATATAADQPSPAPPPETVVIAIPLAGDPSDRNAELSGLAWYGDWLILLPQYPTFAGAGGDGLVYALPRDAIEAFLAGQDEDPLQPVAIPFVAPGLSRAVAGYEGFEAIVFDGSRAYLTIEASPASGMTGHLVAAEMAPDLSALTVDTARIAPVESATGLPNKSDETLLLAGESIITIHEANGSEVNGGPVAQRFRADLQPAGALPFPVVEYRITDATSVDTNDRFWAINYFFPGEPELHIAGDPIAAKYGTGATHAGHEGVERLLEFQLQEDGITLVERSPIQLQLLPDDLRNWEGIARLDDRGFLLVSDKFPQTILGFVRYP